MKEDTENFAWETNTQVETQTGVEFSEKQRQLIDHLENEVDKGELFFKSKLISEKVDLSPQEIGTNMARVAQNYDGLSIEKWSTSNAVTWKVEKEKKMKRFDDTSEHAVNP